MSVLKSQMRRQDAERSDTNGARRVSAPAARNAARARRVRRPAAHPFREPDGAPRRLTSCVLAASFLALVVTAGCGRRASRKPVLYQVRGRVVDAETNLGVANARVLLRAALRTALGTQVLSSYAVADADGKYTVELSEPFETVRLAAQIRIDVSKEGYVTSGTDLPPPDRKRPFHPAPTILLKHTGGPAPPDVPSPPGVLRKAPPKTSPLPWK